MKELPIVKGAIVTGPNLPTSSITTPTLEMGWTLTNYTNRKLVALLRDGTRVAIDQNFNSNEGHNLLLITIKGQGRRINFEEVSVADLPDITTNIRKTSYANNATTHFNSSWYIDDNVLQPLIYTSGIYVPQIDAVIYAGLHEHPQKIKHPFTSYLLSESIKGDSLDNLEFSVTLISNAISVKAYCVVNEIVYVLRSQTSTNLEDGVYSVGLSKTNDKNTGTHKDVNHVSLDDAYALKGAVPVFNSHMAAEEYIANQAARGKQLSAEVAEKERLLKEETLRHDREMLDLKKKQVEQQHLLDEAAAARKAVLEYNEISSKLELAERKNETENIKLYVAAVGAAVMLWKILS